MKPKALFIIMLFISSFMCFPGLQAQTLSDSTSREFYGKIIFRSGNTVKVQQTDSSRLPASETPGNLSKFFEKVIFGMKTTGWLDVGKMKVESVKDNIVTLQLLEETSVITINGQKEDHFQPGFIVKFTWEEH